MVDASTRQVIRYYEESDRELAQRYLRERYPGFTLEYFEAALRHRYELYPHIPEFTDFAAFAGRDVLEVGVGQGADHYMFAHHGARLSGIDLTQKHCDITRLFLETFGFESWLARADARALPFPSRSFDHVYSCGVLLLLPDIERAIAEIHRVLRPGGHATIMLYNKRSVHYWLKTRLYYGWALNENAMIGPANVRDWYTDGIGYPQTHYYSRSDLRRLFAAFDHVEYRIACFTPDQIPRHALPSSCRLRETIENRFGFFLWVRAWA
jgi:SAM-dependent methyltransferase